jgi:hypothetical protein
VVDHVRAQVIPQRVGVPGRSTQEALDPTRARLPERLGQLPAVRTLHSLEQADQIAPSTLADLSAGEAFGDNPVQVRQPVRPSIDTMPGNRCVSRDQVSASCLAMTGEPGADTSDAIGTDVATGFEAAQEPAGCHPDQRE